MCSYVYIYILAVTHMHYIFARMQVFMVLVPGELEQLGHI